MIYPIPEEFTVSHEPAQGGYEEPEWAVQETAWEEAYPQEIDPETA